jgi:glycosyltransferase involved in cell wall biosynthesis
VVANEIGMPNMDLQNQASSTGPRITGHDGAVRLLTITTLYPNSVQPAHGIFVERRLLELIKAGQITATVLAPVPWFPLKGERFGRYAALARVPARERRCGLEVHHPRFPVVPKIGMSLAPFLLYLAARRTADRLIAAGARFDIIDAHYFYPDGVAALLLARHLDLPVVVTGRGTDLNLIPDFAIPRRLIAMAARRADGLVTVSAALKRCLIDLGIPEERVEVYRNGVDLEVFHPENRSEARRSLGLGEAPLLLSVGLLIERKGHALAIEALAHLPDVELLIVGEGPERSRLVALARAFEVSERVRFVGTVAPEAMPAYYAAADLLVLASSREGWANVLLEAMACGTPVVASDIEGTREVVREASAGLLFDRRDIESLVSAVSTVLAAPPDCAAIRRYAERHGWRESTDGLRRLFEEILEARGGSQDTGAGSP